MTLVNPDDPNDTIESFDVADVVPIGTHLTELAADGVIFTNLRSSSSWTTKQAGSRRPAT